MPLYMDVHRAGTSVTRDDVMAALVGDRAVPGRGGARLLRYWYDLGSGSLFCLVEAPDRTSAGSIHVRAGRLPLTETLEVEEGR